MDYEGLAEVQYECYLVLQDNYHQQIHANRLYTMSCEVR